MSHRDQVGSRLPDDYVLGLGDLFKRIIVTSGSLQHTVMPIPVSRTGDHPRQVTRGHEHPVIACQQVFRSVLWPASLSVAFRPGVQALLVGTEPGIAEIILGDVLQLLMAEYVHIRPDGRQPATRPRTETASGHRRQFTF